MKEIDFLIIYEHKNREFESIALLKHELVRRGYTVEFFSFDEYHNVKKRRRLFNNVKIAIMPSLYHDEEIQTFVYGVAGRVKNIVNLRWEQIFSRATEENLDYYVYPKGNAKYAYHCCWGEKPRQMLMDTGVDEDKLFITGPIQMDFVRKDFNGFYLSRAELFDEFGIDKDRECILFISSFAISSMDKWTLEWLYSQYEGVELEELKKYLTVEAGSRNTIVEWLKKIASLNKCTIIYRPHPAEANTELIEQLKMIDNIKVISDYNIKQWILACDQVYTWNSTSLTEASVAGVPCAVLRPAPLSYNDEYPIYDGFPVIKTFEEFKNHYESGSIDGSAYLLDSEKTSEYLSVNPTIPSYIRTSNVMEEAIKDTYNFPWSNFTEDELEIIEKNLFKHDFQRVTANMIIGPFNHLKLKRRVTGRFFPKLSDKYAKMTRSKKPPISNEEFEKMDERIAEVLSKIKTPYSNNQ